MSLAKGDKIRIVYSSVLPLNMFFGDSKKNIFRGDDDHVVGAIISCVNTQNILGKLTPKSLQILCVKSLLLQDQYPMQT